MPQNTQYKKDEHRYATFVSKIRWLLFLVPLAFLSISLSGSIFAADPTPVVGKAKSVNTNSYLDFNSSPYNSNLTITDPDANNNNIRTLDGYVWSEDLGWIDFGDEVNGGPVQVEFSTGDLTGKAYVVNTGNLLDFDNYSNDASINTVTGVFEGNVWSEDIGWIDFSDTGVYVKEEDKPNNPSTINGYSNSQKDVQIQSSGTDYYNFINPYFEWVGATDPAGSIGYSSGLSGYYVYFGTDPNAIPSTHGVEQSASNYTAPNITSEETYYLRLQSIDANGNIHIDVDENYTVFTYTYDSVPPTNPTGLSSPQTYQNNIDNITVYWSMSGPTAATDSFSGVKGYQYRIGADGVWHGLDHSGNQDCSDLITTGYYTLDSEVDSLEVGGNTFYLRTFDNACNVTQTYTTTLLKYSGVAPSEPQNLSVSPITNTENSFSFEWEKPVSFIGQENGLSYCYTVNIVPSSAVCNWTQDTSVPSDSYASQPSINTFYVVAKDEASNVNYSSYTSVNFTANTPAPSIPLNIEIADVSVKVTSSWKLVLSWDEPTNVGVGIEYYQIHQSANGIDFSLEGTTSDISYVNTGLTQETYFYKIKACDSSNNCSAFSPVVSMYPTGKFTEPAELISTPLVSNISTKKANILWVTDRNSDSRIQFGNNSGEYFEEEIGNSVQTTEHGITLNNLLPGTVYYFRAKWTDEDGNVGVSNEMSFKTLPTPKVKSALITKVGLDYAILNIRVVGADRVNIIYGKTTSYGGVQAVNTSPIESDYSVILSNLDDGSIYHFNIQLVDLEGESYTSIEDHEFTTLSRPRITNVRVEEKKGVPSPTVEFTWESNTKITSVVTYKPIDGEELDQISLKLISGKHSMLVEGLKPETVYTAFVEGVDKGGNVALSDELVFTTETDTRPPEISNVRVTGGLVSRSVQADKSRSGQLIVTWESDEPSYSRISYGEGSSGGFPNSTSEDPELRTKHTVVISTLSPSKVYHLNIICEDTAGNSGQYGPVVSITPKSTDTVAENVLNSLSNIFFFLR